MNAKKLGKKIKLARVEMDMTQEKLAKSVGMMQHTISHYERAMTSPSLEILEKLALTLNKPFYYFLEGVIDNWGTPAHEPGPIC